LYIGGFLSGIRRLGTSPVLVQGGMAQTTATRGRETNFRA
jgi:hypothetical protein